MESLRTIHSKRRTAVSGTAGVLAACALACSAHMSLVAAQGTTTGVQQPGTPPQTPTLTEPPTANVPDQTSPTGTAPAPGQYDATLRSEPLPAPSPVAYEPSINPPPLEPIPVRRRTTTEGGFSIGVPVWFRDAVNPGVAFEGRIARRFGHIAPELSVGWQINWIDEDNLPSDYRAYNLTVDAFYLSAGARVYALEEATVNPFISAAFDLAFWHLTGDQATYCGWYYCTTAADYDVGIGMSGKLGVAFLPSERTQLELGAKFSVAFAVGPVDEVEVWLTPFIGFTARM